MKVPFSLEEDLPVLAQAVVVLVEVFLLCHDSLLGDAPALVKFERRLPYSFDQTRVREDDDVVRLTLH